MDKESRILVSGATGFIGSYILRTLVKNGYQNVVALKRRDSKLDLVEPVLNDVQWIEADILDPIVIHEAMDGVHAVIHAAAFVSFDRRDEHQIMKVNVEGTSNMINASIDSDVRKFIHVSSIAVFSRSSDPQEIDELSSWDYQIPATDYAISKYKAEMEVWRGAAEGLRIAIVNPSLVLGGGFWESGSASLFKKVYEGVRYYPKGLNGFVDVRDVAKATIKLMESPIVNQRFIINGENRTYKDIMDMMAKALHRQPPSIALNPFLREMALFGAWFLRTFLGKEEVVSRGTLRNAQHSYYFDASKSKEELGIEYRDISDTIAETCKLLALASQEQYRPKYLQLN